MKMWTEITNQPRTLKIKKRERPKLECRVPNVEQLVRRPKLKNFPKTLPCWTWLWTNLYSLQVRRSTEGTFKHTLRTLLYPSASSKLTSPRQQRRTRSSPQLWSLTTLTSTWRSLNTRSYPLFKSTKWSKSLKSQNPPMILSTREQNRVKFKSVWSTGNKSKHSVSSTGNSYASTVSFRMSTKAKRRNMTLSLCKRLR